jgi:hypothetical protein
MAYFFNGTTSSRHLEVSATGISGVPMTIACWVRRTSNTITGTAVSSTHIASQHQNRLDITTTGQLTLLTRGSLANTSFTIPTTTTNNTWNHFCGQFESTQYTGFVNGVAGTTNAITLGSQNSPGIITIGAHRFVSVYAVHMRGDIAEVGVWSAILTADEIGSLSKGMACDKVRPQSLIFYPPLIRNLIDLKGARTITNTNGATVVNHTRIYQ